MSASIQVGDLTNSFTKGDDQRDAKVTPSTPSNLNPSTDALAILTELSRRLNDLENRIVLKADGGNVLSHIAISKEAILIASDKIAVAGETSFFDYVRDINGTATGQIDPSMTLIRGGVIQTEQIKSGNWDGTNGSYFDLDSGNILIGGLDAPRFYFENAHDAVPASLNVRGNIRVWDNGTELGLFATGDANYTTAGGATGSGVLMGSPGIFGLNNGKVTFGFDATTGEAIFGGNKSTTSAGITYDNALDTLVIKGSVKVVSSGSQVGTFTTGTAAWTGGATGTGTGVVVGEQGIAGLYGNNIVFGISTTTGSAYFKGDITGASGNFSGNLITSGYSHSSGYNTAGFYIGSTLVKGSTFGDNTISAITNTFDSGVVGRITGVSSTGNNPSAGVVGVASISGSIPTNATGTAGYGYGGANGGYFQSDWGNAIRTSGKTLLGGSVTLAGNVIYDIGAPTVAIKDIYASRIGATDGIFTRITKSSWATGQIGISASPTGSSPTYYYYRIY